MDTGDQAPLEGVPPGGTGRPDQTPSAGASSEQAPAVPPPAGWGTGAVPPPAGWGTPPPAWGPAPHAPAPAWVAATPPPPAWSGGRAAPAALPGAIPGWNPAPPASKAPVGVGGFRARGVGELLDGAFRLYRRNLLLIVAIAAVVQVPFALLQYAIFVGTSVGDRVHNGRLLVTDSTGTTTLTPGGGDTLKALAAYAGIIVILQVLVVTPLSLAAMSRAVSDRYLDRPTSVGAAYRAALGRFGALLVFIALVALLFIAETAVPIVAIVLSGLAGGGPVTAGLGVAAFFVIPVAWLITGVRLCLAPQAIVVERLGGLSGMRRSWRLLRNAFWRTLGILVLVSIIQAIVGSVVTVPVSLFTTGLDPNVRQLVSQVASAIANVFVAPLTLITLTLLYYDMRIRREAFDIEMLAARL